MELSVEPGVGNDLDDTRASSTFRVSNQVQSVDQSASSGELLIVVQREGESAGSFELEFGLDDYVHGCFHAFPSLVTSQGESAP